jgi:hypothetical protein
MLPRGRKWIDLGVPAGVSVVLAASVGALTNVVTAKWSWPIGVALVESLGSTASAKIYLTTATDGVADNTHFSEYAAGQMADLVVQGIRDLNLPLVPFLR